MIVTVNYERQLRDAYTAGVAAMALYQKKAGPKPDVEKYIAECRKEKPIARF